MTKKKHSQERARILIVDDQVNNLVALEHALKNMPADLIRATSGGEALRLLTEHEYALILLEVQMPGMDGFEMAELIRQNHYTESIPIIFITVLSKEKSYVFKGCQTGPVDYLFKPIEPFLLTSKVQIFLDVFYQKTQGLFTLLKELQTVRLELESNNRDLELIASHDSLTDLPNRREFELELNRTVSYADRYNTKFALLFLDLDNFKSVNDNYGHGKGDALLKAVSEKLSASLRKEDFLARLGGDEFAIILSRLESYDNAGKIAETIKKAFEELHVIDGVPLSVTTSIGIACYPFAGETKEDLITNADIAMYRAKSEGKNVYHYFSEQLSREYRNRATVEKALHQALALKEFHMDYQIIYDLITQKPKGAEAFVRWNHPRLGEVSPDSFIPISEEIGIIQEIGLWTINESCHQFCKWCEEGFDDFDYAINLSLKQLQQTDLVAYMQDMLLRLKLDPNRVTLELTETAIMENIDEVESRLKELHHMGLRISIDDFGTGYSSLVRLRHLPIYALKIDQSFVRDVILDKHHAIIVKTILSLSKSLGLPAIAEGIETKQQLDFLIKHGCEYGQGYYLSKPMTSEKVTQIFNEAKDDKK